MEHVVSIVGRGQPRDRALGLMPYVTKDHS